MPTLTIQTNCHSSKYSALFQKLLRYDSFSIVRNNPTIELTMCSENKSIILKSYYNIILFLSISCQKVIKTTEIR